MRNKSLQAIEVYGFVIDTQVHTLNTMTGYTHADSQDGARL